MHHMMKYTAKHWQLVDHDEKHQLYGELQQILTDQAASVFIEDPADFDCSLSNKYTGYQSYPVSAIDLSLDQTGSVILNHQYEIK